MNKGDLCREMNVYETRFGYQSEIKRFLCGVDTRSERLVHGRKLEVLVGGWGVGGWGWGNVLTNDFDAIRRNRISEHSCSSLVTASRLLFF